MTVETKFFQRLEPILCKVFPDWPCFFFLSNGGNIRYSIINRDTPYCQFLLSSPQTRGAFREFWKEVSDSCEKSDAYDTTCPFGLKVVALNLAFSETDSLVIVLYGVRAGGSGLPDFETLETKFRFPKNSLFTRYEHVPVKRFSDLSRDITCLADLKYTLCYSPLRVQKQSLEQDHLHILHDISIFITSSLDLQKILDFISGCLGSALNCQGSCIFLKDSELSPGPYKLESGYGIPLENIHSVSIPEKTITTFLDEMEETSSLALHEGDSLYFSQIVKVLKNIHFRSLLCVPIKTGTDIIGLIFLFSKKHRHFTETETEFVLNVSDQICGAIRNAKLYRGLEERSAELQSLFEMTKDLSGSLKLTTVLDNIARFSTVFLQGHGCIVRILNKKSGDLIVASHYGIDPNFSYDGTHKMGEGVAGWVAEHRESVLIPDVTRDPRCAKINKNVIHSIVCVPLIYKDQIIGTISVYDKLTPSQKLIPFTEKDRNLLGIFALIASQSFNNAQLHNQLSEMIREKEKSYNELNLINKISVALIGAMDPVHILYIVATGVTAGVGLGFNRCVIFLGQEDELVPEFAVGPASHEEVSRLWESAKSIGDQLEDFLYNRPDIEGLKSLDFFKRASRHRIPLTNNNVVPIASYRHGEKFAAGISPYQNIHPELLKILDADTLAVVPIAARDKNLGIIAVDSVFNKARPTADQVSNLQTVANLAGLGLESVRLYEKLREAHEELRETTDKLILQERLAALGQMASTVAHDFRNPLATVGGYARRMKTSGFQESYLDIILDETARLEEMVRDILDFSRDYRIVPEKVDLLDLCKSLFAKLGKEKNLDLDIKPVNPDHVVTGDRLLLSRAIGNILENAIAFSPESSLIQVTLSKIRDGDRPFLKLSIADSGPGISPGLREKVFEPFYTERVRGTGLGLAIARRIINLHDGTIRVTDSVETSGAQFEILFPTGKPEES